MHRFIFPSNWALCFLVAAASGCASTTGPGNENNPPHDAGHTPDAAMMAHDAQGAPPDAGSSKDSSGAAPESGSASGAYTVNGPTILDSNGKPHLFRGLSRP